MDPDLYFQLYIQNSLLPVGCVLVYDSMQIVGEALSFMLKVIYVFDQG